MTAMLYMLLLLTAGIVADFSMRYMFSIADKRLKSSLSLFLAFLVVWTLAIFLQSPSLNADTNLFLVRIAFVASTCAVMGIVVFSFAVTRTKLHSHTLYTLLSLYLALVALEVSPYVISSVTVQSGGIIPVREPLYYLVIVGIVSIGAYGIGRLYYHAAHTHNRLKQRQYRFIATGLTIGLMLAVITNIVLPNVIGTTIPARFSAVAVIVFVGTILYASLKHKFIDLKFAAVRTIAYVFSLMVMAVTYFGLAYILSIILFEDVETSGVSMSAGNIVIALVLAFIFQPIRQFFDKITNQLFYRDRYDTDVFIARLGAILTSTTDLHQLLKQSANEIEQTMKASFVTFVVFREEKSNIVLGAGNSDTLHQDDILSIKDLVNDRNDSVLLVNQQLEDSSVKRSSTINVLKFLQNHHVELVLYLDDVGLVLLGDQKGAGYSQRDIRTLEMISDELIIAIQNARSVQEVQDINIHLEQRIDKATAELRRSNEKLKKLDATKDEFLSMASHQLRTPLTSIKGYISMVLDGDAGTITPQQEKLLKEAFVSSERMVRLIGDFLNVSRLQTGKFVIERRTVNLSELVRDEIESIQSMAATRDIELSYKGPKQFPVLQLDEDKIRQVVMNFIDNAIYYSRPQSTIVVRLAKDEKYATLEVHDHGIGVPKESLEKLFTKFFRAENARRQRPDGTGVGLYLAKRVITEHGGELIVESTEGKGSVFGFRLPLKDNHA